MKRIPLVLALALLAAPAASSAQDPAAPTWQVTLQLGVHADRLERPERMTRLPIAGVDAESDAFTTRGEAPAVGVRATRWLGAHFGLDAGAALAQNSSWQGMLQPGQTAPVKRTLFASIAPVWRVLPPEAPVQLQLGAGPALVRHGGTGDLLLTRATDLGGMALADASIELTGRVRFAIEMQNYRFTSRFDKPYLSQGTMYPAGNVGRSEWVFQAGVRLEL